MRFQELAEYMLFSKSWRAKERLFFEVFPEAQARSQFFGDFGRRLIDEYRKEGRPVEVLNDLMIRKLAIEWWFGLIPKSLLKEIDLND